MPELLALLDLGFENFGAEASRGERRWTVRGQFYALRPHSCRQDLCGAAAKSAMKNSEALTFAKLVEAITTLCLENEVAPIMLREYWPPSERISSYAALKENCRGKEAEFRSRAPISQIQTAIIPASPAQFSAFLLRLSGAIEKTRLSTMERVEKARGTL